MKNHQQNMQGVVMAHVYVTCKKPECGAEVLAPEEVQVSEDKLQGVLLKRNFYLCQKCGKVSIYTKEDHHFA
jgi:hypothetical protein